MSGNVMDGCPAHVPADRVREFDYAVDPVRGGPPIEGYLALRGEPTFWSTASGGFWVLTEADHIRRCFQDASTFSNKNVGLGYSRPPRTMIPEQLDPPEHGKYRRLLSPYFTPQSAAALTDDIRRTCRDVLDALLADSAASFEVVDGFTGRFPQIVFLEHVLHLPVEQMDTFLGWEHDMMHHPKDPEVAMRSTEALLRYLEQVVAERAHSPVPDDMLSELLTQTVDGRRLTQDEALDIAYLLFAAGLDTVTSALSFTLHFLATNPGHRRQLVDDPTLVPSATEELLRYHSFVSSVRTATRDVEFAGVLMKEGDRVLPSSVLAAHDPDEFERPDEVDFHRTANRHIAFGAGPHRCLGSHLARTELHIALEEFHRRVPAYELDPDDTPRFHAAGVLGVDRLVLRRTELVDA